LLTSIAVRTHCLDASALVKYYTRESGSAELRAYLHGQANWYTTPFCLFEALSVLKAKAKNKNRTDRITEDQYHRASHAMLADFDARSKHLPDLDFIDPLIFSEVQALGRKYPKIDFSDAFQILSVKKGYYSRLCGDSQTVLVTADGELAKATEVEGLKVEFIRESNSLASAVSLKFLLEGYAYSLEQCGLLLRDANVLYRAGSFANAVVLTGFAQEELGRSTILLDLRRQVRAGKNFTLEEVWKRCSDHNTKQKAGMLSITLTGDDYPEFGKWLRIKLENHPQSAEWQRAEAELARLLEAKKKRLPGERHKVRMSSLYVDPISEREWKRPVNTRQSFAEACLLQTATDYAGRYYDRYITSVHSIAQLQHRDPDLYDALAQWPDRPELPRPEWPGVSPE
jgi:AbiV family abortive infection protein